MEIRDGSGEAIDARDNQFVSVADEVEEGAQFLSALYGRAADLLSPDDAASRSLERFVLDRQILIGR